MKEIPLTQGQVALVDDEDYDMLMQWKWYASYSKSGKAYYAARNILMSGRRTILKMHRYIMSAGPGEHVDHENHDTLDNRKENMRLGTHQENLMNRCLSGRSTSGFCGVTWHEKRKKWKAHIKIDGRQIHLGRFADKADAITARQAANIKYGFHANHGKPYDCQAMRPRL